MSEITHNDKKAHEAGKALAELFRTGIPELDNNNPMIERLSNPQPIEPISKRIYLAIFKDGVVKVGVAKDIDKRIRQIEKSSGRKLINLFATEETQQYSGIVAELKKHLAAHCLNGDFFELQRSAALKLVTSFCKKRSLTLSTWPK